MSTIDEPIQDAALIDVPVVMLDACVTYSTQVNTCTVPVGADTPLDLTGTNTYSSETGMLTRGQAAPVPIPHVTVMTSTGTIDVIFASSFSLAEGGTLRLSGPLPVAIAVSGTAQIDGLIDLRGPAAGSRNDVTCGESVGEKGENDNGGGGGGGGGAFQGKGGEGSDGDADAPNNMLARGGDGGDKIARPLGLLGGCDGGDGGEANGQSGSAGDGGGAVLIAAGISINVGQDGAINAGGGGGSRGGGNGRGGGGGGSGGMILLESKQVVIAGVLAANGGGGGEGNTNGRSGQAGLASADPAQGGAGGDNSGGDGADGAAGTVLDGSETDDVRNGGGGGGGGGVGYIAIASPSTTTTGTVSPAFMPWP